MDKGGVKKFHTVGLREPDGASASADGALSNGLPAGLNQAELLDFYKRLLVAAHMMLRRSPAPPERDAGDYAADALVCAIENLRGSPTTRIWDETKLDLMTFCVGVIRSRISADRKRAERRASVNLDEFQDDLRASYAAPQERAVQAANALDRLEDVFRDDKVAAHILHAQRVDPDASVVELGSALGVTSKTILAARRRIQRAAHKLGQGYQ